MKKVSKILSALSVLTLLLLTAGAAVAAARGSLPDDSRNIRGRYVDYIYLTDAARSFEPVRVYTGGEFLGLTFAKPLYARPQ